MKPLHVAVLAAAVAVGVVLVLMIGSDDGRSSERGPGARGAGRDGGTTTTKTVKVGLGGGGDEAAPEGALEVTLTVVDADGAPAAGAELALSGRLERRGGAGADGTAKLDGLAPGLYDLVARKGKATACTSFELKADADLGTLRLAEAVAIRGTVYDAQKRPVKGAVVEATVADAPGGFDLTMMAKLILEPEPVASRAVTGEDGVYELLVAKGGRFGLRVAATDLAPEGEAPRAWTVDTEGLDFYLFPGVGLSGRVSDRAGRPVAGARVLLLDPLSVLAKRIPKQETTSGGDGSFALSATPSDETMLVVRATGYATHMATEVRFPQHDLQIVLEAGIRVRIQAVRESDPERPAPGVHAMVMYHGSIAVGVTGDDGVILLENLPRESTGAMGDERAGYLWGGGFVPRKVSLAEREPGTDGLVDAGRVEMADGGIVRGRVLDKATGEPVAGAELRSHGDRKSTRLNSSHRT